MSRAVMGLVVLVRAVLAEDDTRKSLVSQMRISACCAIYALIVWSNVDNWRAHKQFFVERDADLSYPYLDSTVSNGALAVTATILPLACVGFAVLARVKHLPGGGEPRRASGVGLGDEADTDPEFERQVNAARALMFEVVCYIQALSLTMGTYNACKCFVGKLRPNFFAACDYKGYRTAVETGDYAAYLAATTAGAPGDRKECKSSQDDIDEASLSFPSGHAGLSFVAMSWAAFALAEAADVAGINDDVSWATPARTAACLPMAYAVYCACTRITDYKHRPEDVIAGALLGAAAAWACRPRRRWNKQHKHAKPVAASGKIHPTTNGVK